MSITTSIEKLSETLTNCKANLKEKEVADVDNIKISDVDEKIAEIQAGGGGGFKYIENVTLQGTPITDSAFTSGVVLDDPLHLNLTFTPKEDDLMVFASSELSVTPETGNTWYQAGNLSKGIEYQVTGDSKDAMYVFIFKKQDGNDGAIQNKLVEPIDSIIMLTF